MRRNKTLCLLNMHAVPFVEKQHLLFRKTSLPFHPNGMRFSAFNATSELATHEYYSVGGGFVVSENASSGARVVEDATPLPYAFDTADELLHLHCQ